MSSVTKTRQSPSSAAKVSPPKCLDVGDFEDCLKGITNQLPLGLSLSSILVWVNLVDSQADCPTVHLFGTVLGVVVVAAELFLNLPVSI